MHNISNSVKNFRIDNQRGFTLIELISVLIIMGVTASVVVKKADLLSESASLTALRYGVGELNSRETVAWFKIKLDTGYSNDTAIYNAIDKYIGPGYNWNPGPNISGGRLHFESQYIDLTRVASTPTSPGSWE